MNSTKLAGIALAVALFLSCQIPLIDKGALAQAKDQTPPVITISAPAADGLTLANIIEVAGTVSDLAYEAAAGKVASLNFEVLGTTINGPVTVAADGSFRFQIDVSTASTSYTLQLSAKDWGGNLATKNLALSRSATAGVASFAAVGGNRSISLSWALVPRTQSYTLYYTQNGTLPSPDNFDGAPISIPGTQAAYTLPNTKNGSLYTFRLVTNPEAGYLPYSSDFVRVIPLSAQSLAPQVTGAKGGVLVSWPAIAATRSFAIWRSASGAAGSFVKLTDVSDTQYQDSSANVGQTYFYAVIPSAYATVMSYANCAQAAIGTGGFSASAIIPGTGNASWYTMAIDQTGRYLYAGNNNLQVYKVVDSGMLEYQRAVLTPYFYYVSTMLVQGNSLYCAVGPNTQSLYKYSLADPSNPVLDTNFIGQDLGWIPAQSKLAVVGNTICVARGANGVSVYDSTTGALKWTYYNAPVSDATKITSTLANDLATVSSGGTDYLVVAETIQIEHIDPLYPLDLTKRTFESVGHPIEILDPSKPLYANALLSTTLAQADFVSSSGSTLFAVQNNGSMKIYDCSSAFPTTPTGSLHIDNGFSKAALLPLGQDLVVGSMNGTLFYYNISNLANPFLIGALGEQRQPTCLATDGRGHVYCNLVNDGININTNINQYAAQIGNLVSIPIHPYRMKIQGSQVYIVGAAPVPVSPANNPPVKAMISFDLSSPGNQHQLALPWLPNDLAISGPWAYVASNQSRLVSISLADPAHPALSQQIVAPGRQQGVGIYGERLLTPSANNSFNAFDLADPAAIPGPVFFSTVPGANPSTLWISGSHAYNLVGAQVRQLGIVDLGDGSVIVAPNVTGEFAIAGKFLYARQYQDAKRGLAVLSLENPLAPTAKGFAIYNDLAVPDGDIIAGNAGILGIAVSGDSVFVANGSLGVARFNVANPLAPYFVGAILPVGMTSVSDVCVSGATLLIGGDTATGYAVAIYKLVP